MKESIARLEYLCTLIPPIMEREDEEQFSVKSSPGKWSKKEILGHLIDSATHNHHRFVRCRFEDAPNIFYDQDRWVTYSRYQSIPLKHLVHFWTAYNKHLVDLLKLLSPEDLQRVCIMKDGSSVTLDFLVDDYVLHLEHHLRQLVRYEEPANEEHLSN